MWERMFIQLHLRLHVCLRLQARRTCIHDLVCMQKSWTQHLSACLTYCNTPDDQSLKFPDNLVTMIQGVRILSQARKEVIDQDCIAAVLTGPFCHCCTEERDGDAALRKEMKKCYDWVLYRVLSVQRTRGQIRPNSEDRCRSRVQHQ